MKRKLFFAFILFALRVNAQVHLQTGAAQFSLPLYAYNDANNRIGFDITLHYIDGNGLKVNEIASSVGTGWALQFGGEIVRVQNGEADDQYQPVNYSYGPDYTQNYYPNGFLYAEAEYHPSIPVKNGASFVPNFASKQDFRPRKIYLADREQDVFQASFNGRTGDFVIGKNGVIQLLNDAKLKIEMLQENMAPSIRTTISGFAITDENGIKYVFKDRELSEVVKYDRVQLLEGPIMPAVDFDPFNYWGKSWGSHANALIGRGIGKFVVSKWFLSEISNPLTNKRIVFKYEDYNVETNGDVSFQKAKNDATVATYSMSVPKMKGISKRITSIACSPKESVNFNYNSLPRQDVPYDKSLSNIEIVYGESVRYKWQFTLGYTGRNTILPLTYLPGPISSGGFEETPYLRLCLLSVQKHGSGTAAESPYEFAYNMGNPNNESDRIPARFSFFHDHWGYSNAALSVWLNLSHEEYSNALPDAIFGGKYGEVVNDPIMKRGAVDKLARNGILKSIKYPSGGTLLFDYEQNTAYYNNTNFQMGGVRVKQTVVFDGVDHSKDIVTDYRYADGNNNSSGWGYEPAVYTRDQDITVYKSGGPIGAMNFAGVPALMPKVSNVILILISKGGRTASCSAGQAMLANGLSVIGAFAVTIFLQELYNLLFSAPYQNFTTHITYSEPINYGNPLPFQYKRVEVRSSAQANNGKTVYEFTSPSLTDRPLEVPAAAYPYANKQRSAGWVYGLPKSVTVLDKDNHPQKRTENSYNHIVNALTSNDFISQKWSPLRLVYRGLSFENDYVARPETDHIASDYYYPLTGRTELVEQKEYVYNRSGSYAMISTKYYYNNNWQVSLIKTHNAKGELIENRTYYPADYSLAGAIQTMKNQNILAVPVATQTFITKPSGKYLIGGSVNEYGVAPNGDVKLYKTYQYENATPVPESAVAFSPSQLIPNTAYYKEKGKITYDAGGLPSLVTADTREASSIYDYEGKLATATIVNAAADEVAYTSFEAENKGNWTYDVQSIRTGFAPMGRKYFEAKPGYCLGTGNLNPLGKYVLSFWCTGGLPSLTKIQGAPPNVHYSPVDATLLKTYANRTTGWTYYEYEVTNTANLSLDNGCLQVGNGVAYPAILIDEVRLYPAKARLATINYAPLIGKTSECDVNGRITYYEYDGLGRLKTVRDENRHVLKAYEYNLKTVFYNSYQSVPFTKQSCPTGYSGTTSYYTIPAGKYSSLISQDDADSQANAEAASNGQNYANVQGTCYLSQSIYAEISYENVWNTGSTTYADVVVRFYDTNGTPFTVYNYNLSYRVYNSCGYGNGSYSVTANGAQMTLAHNAPVYYTEPFWNPYTQTYEYNDCYVDYSL